MTPEEAIEYLKRDKSGVVFNQQARQLGIEALERLEKLRDILDTNLVKRLLPSETE